MLLSPRFCVFVGFFVCTGGLGLSVLRLSLEGFFFFCDRLGFFQGRSSFLIVSMGSFIRLGSWVRMVVVGIESVNYGVCK